MRSITDGVAGRRAGGRWVVALGVMVAASSAPVVPVVPVARAQEAFDTPVQQFTPAEQVMPRPRSLRDAARNDRWLGLGVRDVRWSPDGSWIYFRWNLNPRADDVPEADPWFVVDRDGGTVRELTPREASRVPGSRVAWSADGERGAWISAGGAVVAWERGGLAEGTRISLDHSASDVRVAPDGTFLTFEAAERLYRWSWNGGLELVARRTTAPAGEPAEAARWLERQQSELFEHVRRQEARERIRSEALGRGPGPQSIPVPTGTTLDDLRLSPDGRYLTFLARTRPTNRPATTYVDYLDPSGYARAREARPKAGEPRDRVRLGIVALDPSVPDDEVRVRWVELAEAEGQETVPHGPDWSLQGDRAVVQFMGEHHRDLWIAELDVATGATRVLVHEHDDAWLGGPPIQAGRLEPGLLEWLPEGDIVYASERSGWSHLVRITTDGERIPLTEGDWEVRAASLTRDRSRWILQASREHPADDHLYTMPARGGELVRLSERAGRHAAIPSPDGERLAVVHSDAHQLEDLFLRDAGPGTLERRVTMSGNAPFYEHPLTRPEIVSFRHPDGGPLWAALYSPATSDPLRPAVIHVHGGGYRQFATRGFSVYGYALHLGFIEYLVQEGYTVLDFDYRGSAGYGRDYRTDIARSMGISDADGAVAAARYLVDRHGIDPARIGIYGVSYGGFLTLMSQFRYPGVFAAGIARAAVTDWAHYSDSWTTRILDRPQADPDAYARSSPIHHAGGLEDALLITHGLVDDNVHFQDAARLIQRLIELEKDFEVMVYPVEPHTIQTESSRYDYVRRATRFFDRHLRDRP